MRAVHVDPPQLGVRDGLAYARFTPAGPPRARVVVLHGAGSVKESHYAWGRACRAHGFAAVCFDMRGHGESDGRLDGRVLEDIAAMAQVAGDESEEEAPPLVLRGSSMGGWLALAAGARLGAAVVAICPATGAGLVRALRAGSLPEFGADVEAIARLAAVVDDERAAARLGARLLLLHATGDETVPVMVSRTLHAAAPGSRYVEVPGGHHRSIQHDGELQAYALRWIDRTL